MQKMERRVYITLCLELLHIITLMDRDMTLRDKNMTPNMTFMNRDMTLMVRDMTLMHKDMHTHGQKHINENDLYVQG